ncbi:MAG: hypothetical protein HWE20_15800 [Gammaproteobacteria bacterium]|nr:hypothetical protein [Gammaproteobacteria bacterium]
MKEPQNNTNSALMPLWLPALLCGLALLSSVDQLSAMAVAGIDQALSASAVSWASARVINATVSVLQSTSLVFVQIGEVLDPINDLIERFSSLMLLSLSALTAQKLLLMMFGQAAIEWVVTLSGVACALALFAWPAQRKIWLWGFVATVGLRWILLLAVLISGVLSELAFEPLRAEAQGRLEAVQSLTQDIEVSTPSAEDTGFLDKWVPSKQWLPDLDLQDKFDELSSRSEQVFLDVVLLSAIFLLEALLLPLVVGALSFMGLRALGRMR